MTEFEAASLFFQIIDTAQAALTNFLTVVFAVIVVGYLAADKLDRTASTLLVVVYSLFCFGMGREIYSLYSDLARLGFEIAKFPGDVLSWHGMASSSKTGPDWLIPIGAVMICFLGYFASLIFLYSRWRKLQNDEG